jgi:hypothetical protein
MKRTLLALLVAGPAWAGAWSQPAGHYYAKLSGIFYATEEAFNGMGRRQALGMDHDRFDAAQSFLYLEYGLRPRLTLTCQGSGGTLRASSDLAESRTAGIGDVELGVKYQLTERPAVLAPVLVVKLPSGYHRDYDPPLGTGKVDVEGRLLAARSFYPWPFYLGGEAGYRVRGGVFSNQVPLFLELGATPHPRLFAKVYLEDRETLSRGRQNSGEVGGLQVSEGDYAKAGVTLAFGVGGGIWLEALAETHFAGDNIGAGNSWGLGLSYRR